MYRSLCNAMFELACQVPDWVFLVCGLAILTAALLIPPYLEIRQLVWQRGLQARQYQTMLQQAQDYRAVITALDAHDPGLLERLAYPYLHLKPAGATPLLVSGPGAPADRFSPVDVWLKRPMPRVGVDYPAYAPFEAPWLRFFVGDLRVPAIAAGTLMIFLSLLPVTHRRTREAAAATVAPAAPAPAPMPSNPTAPAPVAAAPATAPIAQAAPTITQLTFEHLGDSPAV
jgi:hypothetical protein